MYLVARLVALTIYVLILFAMCISISNTTYKKKAASLLILYILILSVMGYLFVPHEGADLTRLLLAMRAHASKDLPLLIYEITHTATPGHVLYFCIVGKFGNNHLLPAVSAFITFSFCFSMLRSLLKQDDTQIRTSDIAVAVFLFMSRGLFLQIISTIRTLMALAVLAWCIYQEFYQGKKLKALLFPYIFAASIHSLGQVILLYRIGYSMIERGGSWIKKSNRIMLALFLGSCVSAVGYRYISLLLEKVFKYITYSLSGTGYDYFWERLLCILTLLFLFYVIQFFEKAYRHNKKNNQADLLSHKTQKLIDYMWPLIIADIVFMFIEYNTFVRINWYFSILMLPLVVCTFRELRLVGGEHVRVFRTNLLCFSTVMLLLACARGDLCSLKFFGG